MSTPAAFSGRRRRATQAMRAAVDLAALLDQRRQLGARDRVQLGARRHLRERPGVGAAGDGRRASRAGRRARCASPAAASRDSGRTTPTTGTRPSSSRRSAGSAAAVAELQATTSSFAPRSTSTRRARARTPAAAPACGRRTGSARCRRGRGSPRAAATPGTRAARSGRRRRSRTSPRAAVVARGGQGGGNGGRRARPRSGRPSELHLAHRLLDLPDHEVARAPCPRRS